MRTKRGYLLSLIAICCAVLLAACSGDGGGQEQADGGVTSQDAGETGGGADAAPDAGPATARLQVIHEARAEPLSIEVVGADGTERVADGMEQGTAVTAEVAAGTADLVLRTETSRAFQLDDVDLQAGASYVLAVIGIQPGMPVPVVPGNPEGLSVDMQMVLERQVDADATFRVLHAVPDGGRTSTQVGADARAGELSFGEFSEPLPIMPFGQTGITIADTTIEHAAGTWSRGLQTPELSANARGTLVIRGFFEDRLLRKVEGAWYPAGASGMPERMSYASEARFVHTSPDTGPIGVRLDDEVILEGLGFREATGLLRVPSGVAYEIAVTDRAGADLVSRERVLQPQMVETGMVIGLSDPSDNQVRTGLPRDLAVSFADPVRLDAVDPSDTEVALQVFHASTDAFSVDFMVPDQRLPLWDAVGYEDWTDWDTFEASTDLHLIPNPAGFDPLGEVVVPLASQSLGGREVLLVASGYITPEDEEEGNGPTFDLDAYLLDGTRIEIDAVR